MHSALIPRWRRRWCISFITRWMWRRSIAKDGSQLATTGGMYPQYVNSDGSLSLVNNTQWTVGTWPGLLWSLYQATGNSYYKTQAILFTNPLSVDDTQTSDVGFRVYDSFYPLLQQEPATARSSTFC